MLQFVFTKEGYWTDSSTEQFSPYDVEKIYFDHPELPFGEELTAEYATGYIAVLLKNGQTIRVDGPYRYDTESDIIYEKLDSWAESMSKSKAVLQNTSHNSYNMRAKETCYNGIMFRSRLEARWAVFFDYLNWKWQYEPERFNCYDYEETGETYLPDFYFPEDDIYAEVKGTDEQLFKAQRRISGAIDFATSPISKGLILLGNIPFETSLSSGCSIYGCYLHWYKGVILDPFSIKPYGLTGILSLRESAGYFKDDCSSWPDIPKSSTVNLKLERDSGGAMIYDALHMARSARFDFDDSVKNALNEGRKIIGGIKK